MTCKKILCLFFALCMVGLSALALGEESASPAFTGPDEPLWRGKMAYTCRIYASPDENAEVTGRILSGEFFKMYAFDPSWALISYGSDKGYIRRSCIEYVNTINKTTTPPYGVDVYAFTGIVGEDTPVLSEPGGGEELIVLHENAVVALIGFENGWGKLIFKRQYGYVDSRKLKELISTEAAAETASTAGPLSAFVSFYKITTDEANLGRMRNLEVACEKLETLRIGPGEALNFNTQIGPFNEKNGYQKAIVLVDGGTGINYGGGTCQVSSTLYNAVLQLPGLTVTQRRAHGPSGASYLPHGVDAAVGSDSLNFRFRNDYSFPVRIETHVQDGALYIAIYKAEASDGA